MHCTVQRARTALHYTVHSTRAALYTYRRIVRIVHIPYTVRTVQPRDYRPRGTIREGALLFSAREWLDFYSGGASIRGGLLFARIRYPILRLLMNKYTSNTTISAIYHLHQVNTNGLTVLAMCVLRSTLLGARSAYLVSILLAVFFFLARHIQLGVGG